MRAEAETPDSTESALPKPTLGLALLPVGALIALLGVTIFKFEGDPHLPILLAAAIAAITGWSLGMNWKQIEGGIIEGITIALKAILILMIVGILIGTWIVSGIVPLLIYYGLEILNPSLFLFAACAICCVVSLATGSSWTTAGTVGVALIGVAQGLEVPLPMAAGAIVSGAYFGDKMSPLSDATNLAPAVAGSELFDHIRYMTHTTVPAVAIALVLYLILGFSVGKGAGTPVGVGEIQGVLQAQFKLNPLLLLPPLLIIGSVVLRIPAIPGLFGGAVLGGICAVLFQGVDVGTVFAAAQAGYEADTGNSAVDELLTRGGIDGMMWTVSLVLCALTFGGVMERTGMLRVIAESILKLAKSTGQLVTATIATCIGMNIIAPDQYLSIIVPGRMYRDAYDRSGLHPKLLSRSLEDGGTLSSPLVAWNTCGAFMGKALLVSPLAYFPYAFMNLLSPIIAIIIAFTGFRIARVAVSSRKPIGDR